MTPGRESFVSAASTRDPFRGAEHGAGRSRVPYLALHPMGFSVPPGSRLERWALTPPFHPCPAPGEAGVTAGRRRQERGGLFSVALSVGMPRGIAARVYPPPTGCPAASGYAASRPLVFGLSSPGSRRERFSAQPKSARIYLKTIRESTYHYLSSHYAGRAGGDAPAGEGTALTEPPPFPEPRPLSGAPKHRAANHRLTR